jgi:hypothetical protein
MTAAPQSVLGITINRSTIKGLTSLLVILALIALLMAGRAESVVQVIALDVVAVLATVFATAFAVMLSKKVA